MSLWHAIILLIFFGPLSVILSIERSWAAECLSRLTVDIQSVGYSGGFNVDLRSGLRPGSSLVGSKKLQTAGQTYFSEICPGLYFVTLGPMDSEYVDVSQYLKIEEHETSDGITYLDGTLSFFYSRSLEKGEQTKYLKRNEL